MLAVNYTNMKKNPDKWLDSVMDDCETLIVTRDDEQSFVIMTLDQYNHLTENDFIYGNKKYYGHLLESKKQIEHGRTVNMTAAELDKMADE